MPKTALSEDEVLEYDLTIGTNSINKLVAGYIQVAFTCIYQYRLLNDTTGFISSNTTLTGTLKQEKLKPTLTSTFHKDGDEKFVDRHADSDANFDTNTDTFGRGIDSVDMDKCGLSVKSSVVQVIPVSEAPVLAISFYVGCDWTGMLTTSCYFDRASK